MYLVRVSRSQQSAFEVFSIISNVKRYVNMELDNDQIRKAFKAQDALVLYGENLNSVVNEFLESLDIDSLYQEVEEYLMNLPE